MRPAVCFTVAAAVLAGSGALHAQRPNYAEALQHTLYFYEAQTSGALPLDARVEWRGDSALRDGQDVGRDLTGGWYDAGDGVVWTGNDAFGATLLAWSLVNYRDTFAAHGQAERAFDRLREICLYLHKVVDPTSATGFRIYVGKGSTRHAPPDDPAAQNDRTAALPHEVMDTSVAGAPQMIRPSYWVDEATGGADVAGSVSAALAAASVAFRQAGDEFEAGKNLALARTVFEWGDAHRNANTATRRLTEGRVVTLTTYPARSANVVPRLLLAAAWLHRAERAASTPGYTAAWVDRAETLFDSAANAANRGRPWVNFAVGSEHNGACALLAADTGRAKFVAEADAYADFWLYRRRNDTGLATDIAITPGGFVCRGSGGAWNIPTLFDQAPPLLEWADSPHQRLASRRADTIALFTGTYAGAPVRQLDYLLGFNPLNLSYLQGFAPPGKTWVNNLHYRANLAIYGGFGTPGGLPTRNVYPCYGLLAPGPDHTDFYPVTSPAIDSQISYKEPIIYSGGLLTTLARMIRTAGPAAGTAGPVFPAWIARDTGPAASGFFVTAYREEGRVPNGVRLQLTLNNRASLPAREISTLACRYYFTPDDVDGAAVTATVTGLGLLAGETARVLGPRRDAAAGGAWYVEVRLENAFIVPGEFSRYRRRVQLDLSQSGGTFSTANDFSGAALGTVATDTAVAEIPVYDFSRPQSGVLGGIEPSPGYIQWRRAHFNNTHERAGAVALIAERVGGKRGAISARILTADGVALAGLDYVSLSGSAARVSWGDGEQGEKIVSIPLLDDATDEGREHFHVVLDDFIGGARAGACVDTRVSIEDDDAGGPAPSPATPPVGLTARLANVSVRAELGTGAATLIPGLVIEGGAMEVLVRATGPALRSFGLADWADDPSLTLTAADGATLATNDNWGTSAQAARMPVLFRRVGAFALEAGARDAAWAGTLPRGATTVPVLPGSARGAGLVEIYTAADGPGRMRNLACRSAVGGSAGEMIAGFVITGTGTKRVLLRAAGPSLAAFGVAGVLADPSLVLMRSATGPTPATEIAANDDWPESLGADAARAGAFAFLPGSRDAGLVITLTPGAYTARVRAPAGAAGVALVELYDLDP